MTREDAKDYIREWCPYDKQDEIVKALEQQPCDEYGNYKYPSDVELTDPNTATSMPCYDTISRQAVLDAMFELCDTGETLRENPWRDNPHIDAITDAINDLQPVTPQQKYEDIAKAFQLGMAFGFGEKHDEMDKVVEEIKKVVTPQPKTGHWEWIQYDGNPNIGNWHCSECNRIVCGAITVASPVYSYKYCPNCGAKMEVEE